MRRCRSHGLTSTVNFFLGLGGGEGGAVQWIGDNLPLAWEIPFGVDGAEG